MDIYLQLELVNYFLKEKNICGLIYFSLIFFLGISFFQLLSLTKSKYSF